MRSVDDTNTLLFSPWQREILWFTVFETNILIPKSQNQNTKHAVTVNIENGNSVVNMETGDGVTLLRQ